ncbi:H(+)-transporting V0 sector ATPase subunit d [Cryomyces antarcticus]|uniref:H(+)-transporting V0 sector ATPase subunit d n=1 Tax=Cryomyces antarcticus TaxID=329879 RepID=A0ABR0MAW1_9PEZI|nr:H(+)-transporting V0 sector ATPase subunit d [Cryomyces antarcticus]KAK5019270.1 H(+)-transporting V0 sector ATPase subunit d [Cryomyces antarcticus]KAK5296636.1 H(+)-transporting V0 sector ATPase subunit d [Cryomyces antarcticus]
MPVLCVATNIEELYNSVLIETPLAAYFKGSLSYQDLDELNIEIIRNTLYKNYLEDFHNWVNTHPDVAGTPTAEVMSEVLEFEADRRSINITLNSFGTELSKADRRKMYPAFGRLHPEGTLMLSRADDVEGVRTAVDGVQDYKTFFDQTGLGQGGGSGVGNMSGGTGSEGKSLEDMFYLKEAEISKLAFTRQFTHAVVYAWVKLKEQLHSHMYTLEVVPASGVANGLLRSYFSRVEEHPRVFEDPRSVAELLRSQLHAQDATLPSLLPNPSPTVSFNTDPTL